MFTPQQLEQISFGKQTFGGYDMNDVDEFLEPLIEDYVTLYKENALLKSKMRVLVGKLEEYRKNEASMKDAIVNAQKTCDKMVREAEEKCSKMLSDANASAMQNAQNTDALVFAEKARVEEARKAATTKIEEIQEQMRSCIQALDRIKHANQPSRAAENGQDAAKSAADAVADEISQNLEALVGTTVDTAPKAEPRHPSNDTTTSKFANLQFGRNYDPTHK
ncbi:MAG: DivIVA domain-containing protein [Clostridiales bacterium]|nr:DivIVA domain-containing protein [Clostridiales bacterium]MDD7386720.1 DivIVA domain-containing protein [Bacillota bacterium]MDY6040450.1 DivIVA domain-containing protein [Candidatus Faecousia sp.]